MRADRTVDAALLTVVLALFVASAFGLTELTGGDTEWVPMEWKGVHDAAKALILPLLALRFGLAVRGQSTDATFRNRVWIAMAFCWVGDLALTFSGEMAFLVGLVSFLAGHVMFVMSFRHLFKSGWPKSGRRIRGWAMAVLLFILIPIISHLWGTAGDLAPAVATYALVIAGMTYCSWLLEKGPGVVLLRVGTAAFMTSDLILALGRFGEEPIPYGHFWVIGTYIAAQWALAVGFTEVALSRGASRQ